MTTNTNGNGTGYDFSYLYNTETVIVTDHAGNLVFDVVVREISYGENADIQAIMISEIDIPVGGSKKSRQRQIEDSMKKAFKSGVSAKMSIHEEVTAIVSWKDAKGNDVPITAESLRAIPKYMGNQITEAIERLNPDFDEEFQS